MNQKIEISTGIVFKTILILIALWFLYLVRDVVALLFISVIIVSAIDPAIDWMQKRKIPRSAGVLMIYLVLFLIIGFSVSFLIPPVVQQAQDFSQNMSSYSQKAEGSFLTIRDFFGAYHIVFNTQKIFESIGGGLTDLAQNIFSKTIGVFSGFISTIVVFSMVFYMSVEENGIKKFIVSIAPDNHKKYAADLTERIKVKIGKWMLGQLLLMFIVFILVFIGLYFANVPYALILAIFAGILEIVPYIGPIIAAVPGVIIGFLISPVTGFLALLVYLISQQLENHIITPQVMKRAVGLNPVAIIVALLIGAKLAGVLGAILAIPVATAFSLFLGDLMNKEEK